MADIKTREYPITPTMRLTDAEGRATGEFFRLLKAISALVEAVTLVDGEVTADKIQVDSLEAISAVLGNVIINGDLVINGTVTTGKLAANSATDVTVAIQVGNISPYSDFISQGVPAVSDPDITGMLITFFGFMDRPDLSSGNNGRWKMLLRRNGVQIDETPPQFYDDNFAYPLVAAWFDPSPGVDPVYTIGGDVLSGPGDFNVLEGSLATFTLLKR